MKAGVLVIRVQEPFVCTNPGRPNWTSYDSRCLSDIGESIRVENGGLIFISGGDGGGGSGIVGGKVGREWKGAGLSDL